MTKFNKNAFVEYHSDLNKVIFNVTLKITLFFTICGLLKNCEFDLINEILLAYIYKILLLFVNIINNFQFEIYLRTYNKGV